ncbi:MAG: hypothetical protein OEZ36_09030 [Spirochaetota bacterium]|nr:hypothetical protein [Spirochaetota bacterium]
MKQKTFILLASIILVFISHESFSRGLHAPEGSPVGTTHNIDIGFSMPLSNITKDVYASNPIEYTPTYGVKFGYSYGMANFSDFMLLQARLDGGWHSWSTSSTHPYVSGQEIIELASADAGVRLIFPILDELMVYGDVKFGFVWGISGPFKDDYGPVLGAGVEYYLISMGKGDPNLMEIGEQEDKHLSKLVLGVSFRVKIMTDTYMFVGPYVGIRY